MSTNDYENMHMIENTQMQSKEFKAAIDYIESIHASRHYPKPKIGVMTGQSRVGKTRACIRYAQSRPDQITPVETIRPIIYIKMKGGATCAELYSKLYTALMGKRPTFKGIACEFVGRLEELLKECRTELIVIDEAQHFVTKEQNPTGRAGLFVNDLKSLLDNTGIPIILCGLPIIKDLLSMKNIDDETSEQLNLRGIRPHHVETLSLQETASILGSYEQTLTSLGYRVAPLKTSDTVKKFYIASQGRIGVISEIIQFALENHKRSKVLSDSAWLKSCGLLREPCDNPFKWDTEILDKRITLMRQQKTNAKRDENKKRKVA